MKLLLDTHTFLWFIRGDAKLSSHARKLIEGPNNERLLSIASLWEMAIKVSLGRLQVPQPFPHLLTHHISGNAMSVHRISAADLDELTKLAFHHKDPFDRLIIAQSLSAQIPVVSRDKLFDGYGIVRLW